jgi:16S rRNA (guanine966-N2)-methyltransferase
MTDRVKEAIFSALGEVDGLMILDLYAGSGSLGLEALSRGAKKAIFVENARDAIVKLEENIAACKLAKVADVQWADVPSVLERGADDRMDLVFVDPPYTTAPDKVLADLERIVMHGWLSDEGRVVLHRPAKERALQPFGLTRSWTRDYGQSNISVFTHDEEEES